MSRPAKKRASDAEAAYPESSEAATSGFLFELPLRLGPNHITFQLFDHARQWQTFATARVLSVPLSLLEKFGLFETREFVLRAMQRRFESHTQPALSLTAPPLIAVKRADLFATSRSNLFMIEIAELVAAGFREIGYPAEAHLNDVPMENPPDGTLQIIVAPHEYHLLFLTEKFSRARAIAFTRGVHLLCTEQPGTGWFETGAQWAQYAAGVADLNPVGVDALRSRGVEARRLGLGFHPLLASPRIPEYASRRYDIAFLGAMTDRREEFVARHSDFFAEHNCHIRFAPLGFAKTASSRSYLDTAQRNELLSGSRILLNLHHGEQRYFEWHRILVGLANGCCVISETCVGYGPLVPGRHFVMVEPEHLIAACEYYLANPAEAAAIADAGRKFIETELRQSQQCAAFLNPSAETGDPAPIAHPPALQRQLTRETRRVFWKLCNAICTRGNRRRKWSRFAMKASAPRSFENVLVIARDSRNRTKRAPPETQPSNCTRTKRVVVRRQQT